MKNGQIARKYDSGKFESGVNLKNLLQLLRCFCEIPAPTLSLNIEVSVVKISSSNLE